MPPKPSHPSAGTRRARAKPPQSVPQRIGRYRIMRSLGSGGMGTVYLAEDLQLGRTVALKVLVKSEATPPNLIRRFHAEARTAAKLRHPHIVTVYDSGEADNHLFLALEFIDGPDIERIIRKQGPIPSRRSLEIIRQVAEALEHAHAAGIVHRDIKPSNILIRKDGSATLADMGLARAMGESAASNITRAGYTVGTVDYMAPEQAKSSRAADARSDLYSLGCTWYHMLAGRVPYPEGDLTNKLRAHATGPPPDPRELVRGIPAGIVAVVQRLMAQRPEDRYDTPRALLADLNSSSLTRQSLSADDLRMLSEDYDRAAPAGAIDLHEHSGESAIPAGSTMIEAADHRPRPQSVRQRPRMKTSRPSRPEKPPAPHVAPPRNKPPSGQYSSPPKQQGGDRIHAAIVLAVLLALLAGAIWVFANLDSWIGGGGI